MRPGTREPDRRGGAANHGGVPGRKSSESRQRVRPGPMVRLRSERDGGEGRGDGGGRVKENRAGKRQQQRGERG